MSKVKPTIPKGTRDFGPEAVTKRNYILNIIRQTFERFGFQPIETPAIENLDTLTGKYGEEGDRLIFKILNSGDYLRKVSDVIWEEVNADKNANSNKLTKHISEKALRYDLTIPFARFVAMNQHEVTFPFKRYQIQPVWRADRPQKGRYREFWQCDVDVVGSKSLLNELELIQIYDQVFTQLGLTDFSIKINNRKLLTGLAKLIGKSDQIIDLTVAIDKLDKIGLAGVEKELMARGFVEAEIKKIQPIFDTTGNNRDKLQRISDLLKGIEIGEKGVAEMTALLNYVDAVELGHGKVEFDLSLARGLDYYTGTIYEVKANNVDIGSIGGGGRYDDLTGLFGLPDVPGVGISFGLDRTYDVLETLNLFPESLSSSTQVLFINFDEESEAYCLKTLQKIRKASINAEIFPGAMKMKKQMNYADKKHIPYVVLAGSDEMSKNVFTLKNMSTGEQTEVSEATLLQQLSV